MNDDAAMWEEQREERGENEVRKERGRKASAIRPSMNLQIKVYAMEFNIQFNMSHWVLS